MLSKVPVIFNQIELIADPYSDHRSQPSMALEIRYCVKCKKDIASGELHKIVMYVVQEKFTDHHYEHVECPTSFTI